MNSEGNYGMEKPTINQPLLLVKKLLSSIAIVGLCLVSGVVGSWLYIDSGLFVHQTPKTTELQRVIAEGEVVD